VVLVGCCVVVVVVIGWVSIIGCLLMRKFGFRGKLCMCLCWFFRCMMCILFVFLVCMMVLY